MIVIFLPKFSFATEEIIKEQMEALNISSFINEGEKYTKEIFPDIEISELLSDALTGNIDNEGLYKSILTLLGNEVKNTLTLLRWNFSSNSYT